MLAGILVAFLHIFDFAVWFPGIVMNDAYKERRKVQNQL